MAVLETIASSHGKLEVRSAGRNIRIYVDGVLHSQYNPHSMWTSDVWDLLAIAALLQPLERVERILLLGLGGGTAVHLLRELAAPSEIIAVEWNADLIRVAQQYCNLDAPGLTLVHADARDWLHQAKGEFDVIIDDLFSQEKKEPIRSVTLDEAWTDELLGHLGRSGRLVVNFPTRREMLAAPFNKEEYAARVPSVYYLRSVRCENAIAVCSKELLTRRQAKEYLHTLHEHWPARLRKRLQSKLYGLRGTER